MLKNENITENCLAFVHSQVGNGLNSVQRINHKVSPHLIKRMILLMGKGKTRTLTGKITQKKNLKRKVQWGKVLAFLIKENLLNQTKIYIYILSL